MDKNKKFNILVVDDNKDIARSIEMLLRKLGHNVSIAYDGIEAVASVRKEKPEIILLDIGMPRLNGYETVAEIKKIKSTSGIMIVAVTGYGQPEDVRRCLEAGFHYHYTKPVSLKDFKQILGNFQNFNMKDGGPNIIFTVA